MRKAVILGTGPSVTQEQLRLIAESGLPVFGVNNTYQIANLTALLSCNPEWWDYYWPRDEKLRDGQFDKWTWDWPTAARYGIKHIEARWGDSLSTDPLYIHYGHSSGYQVINLAYHYGVREMILVGYDMRYQEGYSKQERKPGQGRHYFGEYPQELQHWPAVGSKGEFTGLLKCYRTIDTKALGLRIINCSPGSALDFFEVDKLENALGAGHVGVTDVVGDRNIKGFAQLDNRG